MGTVTRCPPRSGHGCGLQRTGQRRPPGSGRMDEVPGRQRAHADAAGRTEPAPTYEGSISFFSVCSGTIDLSFEDASSRRDAPRNIVYMHVFSAELELAILVGRLPASQGEY